MEPLEIPFTYYILPNGKQEIKMITVPEKVFDRASRLRSDGYYFEAEPLTTGAVSFTICKEQEDVAINICGDLSMMTNSIEDLIMNFKGERIEETNNTNA